jgi:hypothetical protein
MLYLRAKFNTDVEVCGREMYMTVWARKRKGRATSTTAAALPMINIVAMAWYEASQKLGIEILEK